MVIIPAFLMRFSDKEIALVFWTLIFWFFSMQSFISVSAYAKADSADWIDVWKKERESRIPSNQHNDSLCILV